MRPRHRTRRGNRSSPLGWHGSQGDLHIDGSESTVGDGTADSTSEGESGVELKTAELGGGCDGLLGHSIHLGAASRGRGSTRSHPEHETRRVHREEWRVREKVMADVGVEDSEIKERSERDGREVELGLGARLSTGCGRNPKTFRGPGVGARWPGRRELPC